MLYLFKKCLQISVIPAKFVIPAKAGIILLFCSILHAAESIPVELKDVGIEEHLGQSISLDLSFTNEEGQLIPLRNYFDGKRPVILTLGYYTCPNICHYLLDGFSQSVQKLSWSVGNQFEVVSVSIHPGETPQVALAKKQKMKAPDSWHFLVAKEDQVQKLAQEVGFHYKYDTDQKEYAHSAAIFILTPDGKISRYLYGIQFRSLDLRLSLLEASQGKIGNVVDKLLLFCYHYDPKGRKYSILATKLMAGAGGLTVLGICLLLIYLCYPKLRQFLKM
ncbi:MAG: SCO family protein [Deltaproteobacteria bacterium]|nr:SCO family protein [Deltaproteobacteria bacterium]